MVNKLDRSQRVLCETCSNPLVHNEDGSIECEHCRVTTLAPCCFCECHYDENTRGRCKKRPECNIPSHHVMHPYWVDFIGLGGEKAKGFDIDERPYYDSLTEESLR